ncbi:MAG: Crp/Fnr family transcriptional regulator [Saprospiraceae bacterium]
MSIFDQFQNMISHVITTTNNDHLTLLKAEAEVRQIRRGTILLEEGEIASELCFVSSGILRFYFRKKGREMTTWFTFANDFATVFDSFYQQTPARESIIALTDCQLLCLPFSTVQKLFHLNEQWAHGSRKFMIRYAIQLEDRIHLLHQSMSAEEKYHYILERHPQIIQYVQGKYIAEYLGITRETLSRIRSSIR